MSSATADSRLQDHKSWLNDLERWKYDAKVWDGHKQKMLQDATHAVAVVEAFLQRIRNHQTKLAEFEKQVIGCEREEMEKVAEANLVETHQASQKLVDECHDNHKRLEKRRHVLMQALAALPE